jgi:Glycosyltransferases involved in cell wall biogenesis
MNAISAVIITRNEERNIKRCLDSIRTVADEIIVVDSFSTDNTVAICREAGARVIQQNWLGYGPQKNTGNNAATHDYILSMDADEALDAELAQAITEEKQKGLKGVYQLSRLNYFYGKFIKHGTEYPDKKIRLFNRRQASWDERLVHEPLNIQPGVQCTSLRGHLLHYTYYRFEEHIQKSNMYTSLSAQDYFRRGKKARASKIIFSPLGAFVQSYILKRGFLDGMHGFVLAVMNAHAAFMRYVKLWEMDWVNKGNASSDSINRN